ncbi:MAG TPA: hypothetical protein VHF51_06495 [Solirubrobacteraceae bacterium]|nr:hypothetical protein [Solirubrobacteraceae bacterium]
MRRSLALTTTVAALFAAALAPAAATAGSWTAPRAATRAGTSFAASVTADLRGRMAVGFTRRLAGRNRAEVRTGRTRDFLRGDSILLQSQRHAVFDVQVALPSDGGRLAAAWLAFSNRAHRVRATTIDARGDFGTPQPLTAEGRESAYQPRFVSGADGSLRLVWSRRTTARGRPVLGSVYGAPFALPAPGVGSSPQVAVDPDGTTVVVWLDAAAGRVLAAQAPAGGTFGAPVVLSGAGRAREPRTVVTAAGGVVAAWLETTGAGNAVLAAQRPRGGAFGPAVQVAEPAQRAFAPRLAATSAGETLLAWVNTNSASGFAGRPGIARLQRLGAGGAPVGRRIRLSPDGARVSEVALAHDGVGSAFAAWSDGARVQARRLAPGGLLGPVRTLSPGPPAHRPAPALAGAAGRAVAAWSERGRIRYSIYR